MYLSKGISKKVIVRYVISTCSVKPPRGWETLHKGHACRHECLISETDDINDFDDGFLKVRGNFLENICQSFQIGVRYKIGMFE